MQSRSNLEECMIVIKGLGTHPLSLIWHIAHFSHAHPLLVPDLFGLQPLKVSIQVIGLG